MVIQQHRDRGALRTGYRVLKIFCPLSFTFFSLLHLNSNHLHQGPSFLNQCHSIHHLVQFWKRFLLYEKSPPLSLQPLLHSLHSPLLALFTPCDLHKQFRVGRINIQVYSWSENSMQNSCYKGITNLDKCQEWDHKENISCWCIYTLSSLCMKGKGKRVTLG